MRDALGLLSLSAAAFAGNYLSVPLFAGVDFLFGGIAVMLAALRLSLVETLVVAVAGSLYTLVLWGHPYALIIFVAEAACVQLAWSRWRGDVVLFDAGFWLLAGIPLVLVLYGLVMGLNPVGVGLIALKQPINGIFYTAAASLLNYWLLGRRRSGSQQLPKIRLAHFLGAVFIGFSLVSMLVALAMQIRVQHSHSLEHVSETLQMAYGALASAEFAQDGTDETAEELYRRLAPMAENGLAVAWMDSRGRAVDEFPEGWLTARSASREVAAGMVQRLDREPGPVMKAVRDSYYVRVFEAPERIGGEPRFLAIGIQAVHWINEVQWAELLALALAFLITLLALVCSRALGRRGGVLMQDIAQRLQAVPGNVRARRRTTWPEFASAELTALVRGAQTMEAALIRHTRALTEGKRRFEAITANLPGGVSRRVMTPDGEIRFTYLSPKFKSIFGIDPERATRDPRIMQEVIVPEDRRGYRAALAQSARTLTPLDVEFRVRLPDGDLRWVRSLGAPTTRRDGAVVWDGIALDTTARKQAEQEIRDLVYYDPLTGLLSRFGFAGALKEILDNRTHALVGSLALIDLSRLDDINQAYGYEFGDDVLQAVAGRLFVAAGEHEIVGRLGGGKFALLVDHTRRRLTTPEQVARWLEGILAEPLAVHGKRLYMAHKLGLAELGLDCESVEEALRRAELALHEARRQQGLRWSRFNNDLNEAAHTRIRLTEKLRNALHNGEFELHYQPQVRLADGGIVAAEALLRWRDPATGLRSPGEFIPVAEGSQLIFPIGEWVIRTACEQLRSWRQQGFGQLSVSVNVSVMQLIHTDLAGTIRETLKSLGMTGDGLTVEMTESVFTTRPAILTEQLQQLKDMGIRIALDDFGKGYSSLSHLQDFPVDEIKIDRAFIQDCESRPYSVEIVRMVLRIAGIIGCDVVAEGIESQSEANLLRELGCRLGQGYLFARPLEEAAFARVLTEGRLAEGE